MSTSRVVKKIPIAMEDLALGIGTTQQSRGSNVYTVHRVDAHVATTTTAEVEALDVTKYTRARVYLTTTKFVDYIYDPDATAGLASTGTGKWVLSSNGTSIVRESTEGFPDVGLYNEGTELKFWDTLDAYTLLRSATGELQWVEEGNVGDEVDVTAASHLTLAQAQASDLKVGQYVRLTDRGGLWKVTSDTPNTFDVIDIGDSLSLTYQVENGIVELDHVGCMESDATQAANTMIAKYPVTRFSARTYNVDYYYVPDNRTVLTAGFNTIIQQNAGLTGDIRIVYLNGDNIHFALDGVFLKGNIDTDTGEQRHGIYINKQNGAIKNINVGNVIGQNLRGDVVYIGSFFDNAGKPTLENINVGNVYAKNVYRNGVSVTNGGKNVTIGDIVEDSEFGCGVCAIDIEPDSSGKFCENITFGDVHGRRVGVVGQFGTNKVRGVTAGHLDLDESRPSSSPAYNLTGNDFYGRCFFIRNADVTIASAQLKGSRRQAIYTAKNVGDNASSLVCKGKLEITACNTERATNGNVDLTIVIGLDSLNVSELVINSDSPATEFGLTGTAASEVKVNIGKLVTNCRIGRFFGGVINNINTSFTADAYALQNIDSTLIIQGGSITAGRISGFNTALLHMTGVALTYTNFKYSDGNTAGFHTIEDGCTVNGVYTARLADGV